MLQPTGQGQKAARLDPPSGAATAAVCLFLLPRNGRGKKGDGGRQSRFSPCDRSPWNPAGAGCPTVPESQLVLIELGKSGAALRETNVQEIRFGKQKSSVVVITWGHVQGLLLGVAGELQLRAI